jgi:hypothetical protein
MSCTDDCDAYVCTHKTTDNEVGPLPFVRKSQGDKQVILYNTTTVLYPLYKYGGIARGVMTDGPTSM